MTPAVIALLCALCFTGGIGGVLGIQAAFRNDGAQAAAVAAEVSNAIEAAQAGQGAAVENLTDLDLVKPLCAPEWLSEDEKGWKRLLCREALCWAQAQSTTTAAETSQCDAIGNLANTVGILELCGDPETPEGIACLVVVNARK